MSEKCESLPHTTKFFGKYICPPCLTLTSIPGELCSRFSWSFLDGSPVNTPAPLSSRILNAGLAAPARLLFTGEFPLTQPRLLG